MQCLDRGRQNGSVPFERDWKEVEFEGLRGPGKRQGDGRTVRMARGSRARREGGGLQKHENQASRMIPRVQAYK